MTVPRLSGIFRSRHTLEHDDETGKRYMYHLYASPNTYSIGVHLLLEETGVPYQIINPGTDPVSTDQAFFAISPHGRVPAIEFPDGSVMCESGAIALQLADTLRDQTFTVGTDSSDRAQYLQWLFYLSSTLQPDVLLVFHPEYYFSDNSSRLKLVAAAKQRLQKTWEILEKQYSTGPWMFEQKPTAVDFTLATVLLWPECFDATVEAYPCLNTMLTTISQRESFKAIMPWHRREVENPPHQTMTTN